MKKFGYVFCLLLILAGNIACTEKEPTNNPDGGVTPSGALALTTSATSVAFGGTAQMTATGGTAPYRYFIHSGSGYVQPNTGGFTAAYVVGATTVGVQDQAGTTAFVSLTISSNVTLTAIYAPSVAYSGMNIKIKVGGGVEPYSFIKLSGAGTLNGNTYTSNAIETAQIKISDNAGNSTILSIYISQQPSSGCGQLVTLHRFATFGDHLITANYQEGASKPSYQYEGQTFNVCATNQTGYTLELRRCRIVKTGKHFVTTASNCDGQIMEGVLGYISPTSNLGNQVIYRYRNYITQEYLSTNPVEGNALPGGWNVDILQGYAPLN